jgi:hypothetical protein
MHPKRLREIPIEEQIAEFLGGFLVNPTRFRNHGMMQIADFQSLEPPASTLGDSSLTYITEEGVHFRNLQSGTSINFAIRNDTGESIVLFGLEVEVIAFKDRATPEFQALTSALDPRPLGVSRWIPTQALFVHLAPPPDQTSLRLSSADQSAAGRGILNPFRRGSKLAARVSEFSRVFERVRLTTDNEAPELPRLLPDHSRRNTNAIPPDTRYLLLPDEVNCFHAIVTAREPGIYFFRFRLSYHIGSRKSIRYSDRVYLTFAGLPS